MSLVWPGRPDREGERETHAQDGHANDDHRPCQDREWVDSAERDQNRQHRQAARNNSKDRHQPRCEFAEHNFRVGQVGHHHQGQPAAHLVLADRSCRRGRDDGDRQDKLDRHDRVDKRGPDDRVLLDGIKLDAPGPGEPDQCHRGQHAADEQESTRVDLPAPGGRHAFRGKDRSQSPAHGRVGLSIEFATSFQVLSSDSPRSPNRDELLHHACDLLPIDRGQ